MIRSIAFGGRQYVETRDDGSVWIVSPNVTTAVIVLLDGIEHSACTIEPVMIAGPGEHVIGGIRLARLAPERSEA